MCNATIRIATSLRLGTHLCAPHDCTHCGRRVDETGLHGLSCRRSTGRLPGHNQLNTIIKQSLASANIPSVLEPQGLSRTDGKRPDGMTITPWAQGRLLIWDATCWDTMAATNIPIAMSGQDWWQTWPREERGKPTGKSCTTITLSQPLWRPWDLMGRTRLPSFTKWHHASRQFQRAL